MATTIGWCVLFFFHFFLIVETIRGMSICPPEDLGVVFPHETNGSKFYECRQGKKIEKDCPVGKYFDTARNICGWTNCKENSNISRLEFYRHETDCNKYYMLMKGKKFLYNCPYGLHFNLESEVCDYPVNANCSINTN